MGPTATTCCAKQAMNLGADCAAAGRERFFWVQTVQTLGAEGAAAGRKRFFWVQTGSKTVQRAGNDFFWVQTVQTFGCRLCSSGPGIDFWVHTMDELEIPKVREDVKQNNPITMDSDYETSLETSGELILSSGNFHLSIWPDFAARSVP